MTIEATKAPVGTFYRRAGPLATVAAFILVACFIVDQDLAFAQREGYKARFSGAGVPKALAPGGMISCHSDMADSTGYYAKDGLDRLLPQGKVPEISLESDFGKQSKRAQWRISFRDKETALVVAGVVSRLMWKIGNGVLPAPERTRG